MSRSVNQLVGFGLWMRDRSLTTGGFYWEYFSPGLPVFLSLLFLFIRFLPMISIFEMRTIVPGSRGGEYTETPR